MTLALGTLEMRAVALAYAERGWAVFPLRPGDKIPLISKKAGGQGCLDATTVVAAVERWWRLNPTANVGVATGAPSDVSVIDVDPRHGGDVHMNELAAKHGGLPRTVMALTGGGGYHLWFRYVHALGNTANRIAAGIDTRGDGGYVVAPPSKTNPTVHPPNGGEYRWAEGFGPEDIELAEAPGWLIERCLGAVSTSDPVAAAPERWRRLWRDGAVAGERNDSVARMTGHLLTRGLDPLMVLDMVQMWVAARFTPALDPEEVERTVASICHKDWMRRTRARGGG